MFADLMKEVKTDKEKNIAKKNVNIQPTVQTQKNVQKKEVDDIENMLANLW